MPSKNTTKGKDQPPATSFLYGIIQIMDGSTLQIQEELMLAKQSRKEGNEGRARVCARRAAGAAAQGYLLQAGLDNLAGNVLESLQAMKETVLLPERVEKAIDYLLLKVDSDHNLPLDVDLITEAETVIHYLVSGADHHIPSNK
jgi:hypothetical protein